MARLLDNELYDSNKGIVPPDDSGGLITTAANTSSGTPGATPLPKPTPAPTATPLPKPTPPIPLPKPTPTPAPFYNNKTPYPAPITGAPSINGESSAPPPTPLPKPTPSGAPNSAAFGVSQTTTAAVPPSSGGVISSAITNTPASISTGTPAATPAVPPAKTVVPTSDPDDKLTALPALNMAQTGPAASVYDLVNKYTSEDSLLRQRLESKAMEYANSRGVQNSSMAAGAATGALLDGITPIATSDAGAQNQINLNNTQATNQGVLAAFGQAGNERVTGMNNANAKDISAANNATQLTAVGMNNTSAQLIADKNNATQSGIAAGNNATTLSATNIQAAAAAHQQQAALAFQAAQNSFSREQQTALQQSDFGFREWSQVTSQGQQAMTTYASQSLNITQLQIPQADKDQMLQHLNYVYTGNPMRAFTLPPPPSYSYGSTPPTPVTPSTPPPPTTTPPPTATPPTTTPPTIPVNKLVS